jgi:phosphate transport system ATP-binding protein
MTEQERRTEEQQAGSTEEERPGLSQAITVAEQDRPKKGLSRAKVFELDDVAVLYDGKPAVREISFDVYRHNITALIGPSGCGKSTLIRCFNRMNDLIPTAKVEGQILYHGEDLYGPNVDPVQARKLIGMVFQKPNPFPKSIYDNIAFGPRTLRMKGNMDEVVERALRRGALWDEVKDRLGDNAYGLSGGQQQRLCIARCIAVEPDVILMDEPCSALDPISTGKIEDLMIELKDDYSIVIVTHNMQQAARVSDMTAVLMPDLEQNDRTVGQIVEYAETDKIFTNPGSKRTEDYVTGRVG